MKVNLGFDSSVRCETVHVRVDADMFITGDTWAISLPLDSGVKIVGRGTDVEDAIADFQHKFIRGTHEFI